jgi:hypothetical protein
VGRGKINTGYSCHKGEIGKSTAKSKTKNIDAKKLSSENGKNYIF